jgi:hypothetical protein
VPAGTNYGCNPASVPSTIAGLSASSACGPTPSISQTNVITTNGCAVTQLFTIVATDNCGNTATAYVTNTWTANTTAPVPLNIQLDDTGTNVILTWTNALFALQSAPAVTGVYTNVPGAASPYTNAITAPQRFYRLEAFNTWTGNTTAPVPLNIQLDDTGTNVILTWTNALFALQSAPAVTGFYTNIPGATSPYTNAITGPQQFFRLGVFVGQPPTVTLSPATITVDSGGAAIFDTTTTGTQLTFQWLLNNGPLHAADIKGSQTGPTLTISPVSDADAGNYTVQVTNPGGTAASAQPSCLVVVNPPVFAGLPGAGNFTLNFSGPVGQGYRIWSSTNLALPVHDWIEVFSGQFGAGVNSFTDATATNADDFYCITVP